MSKRTVLLALALTVLPGLSTGVEVINPRSREYIQQMEHLKTLAQALDRAREAAARVDAYGPLPGFDVEAIEQSIDEIRADLDIMLRPERRRMETLTIQPDALFVNPDYRNLTE